MSQNWEHRGVIPLSAPKFLKRAHRCSLMNSRRSRRSLRWEKLTDERQRRADWEKLRDDVGLWLLQNVETFRPGRARLWGSGVRRKMRERESERGREIPPPLLSEVYCWKMFSCSATRGFRILMGEQWGEVKIAAVIFSLCWSGKWREIVLVNFSLLKEGFFS